MQLQAHVVTLVMLIDVDVCVFVVLVRVWVVHIVDVVVLDVNETVVLVKV